MISRILRSYTFKRVTIIGVGLMGGSLGLAIKKHRLAREVIGFSRKQSSLVSAIKKKAIDTATTDIQKAVNNADLVILAAPVEAIISSFAQIAPHLKRGCIVTDLGSAKAEIVDAASRNLSSGFFVGSHPMAGSEKKGVENASADLYEGASCIMTPIKETNTAAKEKVKYLWTKIGAKVKISTPEEHDEILSYISHLPHVIAYALMDTIPKKFLDYASTGLRDTTRVASSSPELWCDICMANSKNVVKSIDECVKNLAALRKAIVKHDTRILTQNFLRAKEKRDILK